MTKELKNIIITFVAMIIIIIILVGSFWFVVRNSGKEYVRPPHESWQLTYYDKQEDGTVNTGGGLVSKYVVKGDKVTFYFREITTQIDTKITLIVGEDEAQMTVNSSYLMLENLKR